MFKLISEKDTMPKSLFINGVRTEAEFSSSPIGSGGFGNVYKAEHKGQPVALKMLYRGQKKVSSLPFISLDNTDLFCKDSVRKDFCREALAMASFAHQYILPLLGVFEDRSAMFLVLPFMPNGTLSEWRNGKHPSVAEIHRRVRFRCLAVQPGEVSDVY